MGASISRSTTPGELAALLSSLGATYEAYAPLVVDNGINGATVYSFSTKEEIAEALADLGIASKIHLRVITASILQAVEAHAAAPLANAGAAPLPQAPALPDWSHSPGPSPLPVPVPAPGPGAAAIAVKPALSQEELEEERERRDEEEEAKRASRVAPEGTGQRIYDAAKEEDAAALRPLVQEWSGHDVLNWAYPGEDRMTPLIIGSRWNKLEPVQLLLATPGEVRCYLSHSRLSAFNNTQRTPPSLLSPGIDVNKANKHGNTAILYAADCGHIEITRALLAAPGIDVNKANNDGWTAVMRASLNGHIEVMRALLAAPGIDLNMKVTDGGGKGKTALGIAIVRNQPEMAAMLRAAGAEECATAPAPARGSVATRWESPYSGPPRAGNCQFWD